MKTPLDALFVMLMMMGKETVYQNYRREIDARSDIRARWIVVETEPEEWFTRLPVVGANHSLRYGLTARNRVLAEVRRGGRPDVVFFNHILPAIFLKHFRRMVPCVDSLDVTPASLYADGGAYYAAPRHEGRGLVGRVKRRWTSAIYRGSFRVLPYSEYSRRSLIDDYGVESERISVFPPGVDLRFWSRREEEPSVRPFTILFVGNDFIRKGGDVLLKAAGTAACRGMRFVVASKGDIGRVPSNVTHVRQAARNSESLKRLYAGADLFLMPTRGDFGPTSAISEALAMGLPVVTHDIGGIGETIRDGIEGFLVNPDDAASVIRPITKLASDPELRRRMAHAARNRAEQMLDAAKNAARLVEILKEAGHTDEDADTGSG
jgi:glycosyltransferase involved in cell wall biosynthesis